MAIWSNPWHRNPGTVSVRGVHARRIPGSLKRLLTVPTFRGEGFAGHSLPIFAGLPSIHTIERQSRFPTIVSLPDRSVHAHNREMRRSTFPSGPLILVLSVLVTGCVGYQNALREHPDDPLEPRIPDRLSLRIDRAIHSWCILPEGFDAAAWSPGIPDFSFSERVIPLYASTTRRPARVLTEVVKAFKESRLEDVRRKGLAVLEKGEEADSVAAMHYLLALSYKDRPGDQRAHWRTQEGHPCLGGEAAWHLAEQARIEGRFADAASWYSAIPEWDDRWAGSRVRLASARSALGLHDAAFEVLRSLSPTRLDRAERLDYWRVLIDICRVRWEKGCAGYAMRRLWSEADEGDRAELEREFRGISHPIDQGDRVEAGLDLLNSNIRSVRAVLDQAEELAGGIPGMEDYIRGAALTRVLRKRVQAVDLLRRALRELGDSLHRARAHYRLGHVLGRLGREAEGLPELVRAKELGRGYPVHEKTLWRLSRMYRHLERPGDVADSLRELERSFPGSMYGPRFTWALAWSAIREGRFEEALERLEILAARHGHEYNGLAQPRHAQAIYWAGRIRMVQAEPELGRRLFRHVAARWPLSHYGWMARKELGESVTEPWSGNPGDPVVADSSLSLDSTLDSIRLAPAPDLAKAVLFARIGLPEQAVSALRRNLNGHMSAGGVDALVGLLLLSGLDSSAMAVARRHMSHMALPSPSSSSLWNRFLPTPFEDEFTGAASQSGLPRSLLYAIGHLESSFDPAVRSVADAVGLLQVVPSVEKSVAKRIGERPKGLEALEDPAWNLEVGSRFLAGLLNQAGGNLFVLAASYNAGHVRMKGWLKRHYADQSEDFLESLPFPGAATYAKAAGMIAMAYSLSRPWWKEARRVEQALFSPIPKVLGPLRIPVKE